MMVMDNTERIEQLERDMIDKMEYYNMTEMLR